MKKCFLLLNCFAIFLSSSCKSDDDDYTPILIETTIDLISTEQNQSVEINFFLNDSNVPTQGTVSFSVPESGTVEVNDNNTPNDPSDDIIIYTPNLDFFGQDSFTYTICIAPNNCASETITVTVTPVSPVNFDLANMPYATLSEYNLFKNEISNQEPVYGVVEYEPITPLFSDYANKKRFVWMPDGLSASYVEDYEILDFPEGTILIKNFYYDNVQPTNTTRIIETRLMIKFASGWDFANYVWNDEQTEASFTNSGSVTNVDWIEDGVTRNVQYRIPSRSQCLTCHKIGTDEIPIGVKPQSLNKLFNYDEGELNQLDKFIQMGYLEDTLPANIETVVNWKDTSKSLNSRVRSYLDINCAHCHSDLRHCDYRPMRFAFNESSNPINLGECIEPETAIAGLTHIVKPNNTEESVLFFRMNTTLEEYRMPLLGRTLIHEEAVLLIEEWMNSLTTECE